MYRYHQTPRARPPPARSGGQLCPASRAGCARACGCRCSHAGQPPREQWLLGESHCSLGGQRRLGESGCPRCAPTPRVRLYRGTSLIRNTPPVGPYSSPVPRGGGHTVSHVFVADPGRVAHSGEVRVRRLVVACLLVRVHFIIVMIRWTGLAARHPARLAQPRRGGRGAPFAPDREGGKACLLIRKHDHFTPTREIKGTSP